MYWLFYVLGYCAILCFCCMAVMKIRSFFKASPLHIRWELYPVPHEGPERAAYGGSYMEETNWWTKKRHVDHWMDIKATLMEICFLEATYENNRPLWLCSYPFHLGLYMLMGGTNFLIFQSILRLFGLPMDYGFMVFISNVINAMAAFGSFLLVVGGIALIHRRVTDEGLNKYTTREQYFNLAAFVTLGALTICAWVFNANPSFAVVSCDFIYNLMTGKLATPLGSTWFVLAMLAGYVCLVWIPITNMRHVLLKYFMYHDIRWEDKPTVFSEHNQEIIPELLKNNVSWDAKHVTGEGEKDWLQVATTNPAKPEQK